MIGAKIDDAKKLFFDRFKVIQATEKAERKQLSRFGFRVRRRARDLLRKPRNGKSAPPGQPPRLDTGLLRDFVFYVYESSRRSVVIGPALLNGRSWSNVTVPELLENGGWAIPRATSFRKHAFYRPHPYMAPAMQTELKKLPPNWRDAIK